MNFTDLNNIRTIPEGKGRINITTYAGRVSPPAIPLTDTTPKRLRDLPTDLPPVPEGFVLWGWGPLYHTPEVASDDIAYLAFPTWKIGALGMYGIGKYAIRSGTPLAVANGLEPAAQVPINTANQTTPAPDQPNTETQLAERIDQLKNSVCVLVCEKDLLIADNALLRKRLEREETCHAACGVIANANTPASLAQVTKDMHPDYNSGSVQDCIRATKREIELRERIKTNEAAHQKKVQELTMQAHLAQHRDHMLQDEAAKLKAQVVNLRAREENLCLRIKAHEEALEEARVALTQWGKVNAFVQKHRDPILTEPRSDTTLRWLREYAAYKPTLNISTLLHQHNTPT